MTLRHFVLIFCFPIMTELKLNDDKHALSDKDDVAQFFNRMMQAASGENGYEVSKAREYLDAEIGRRHGQMQILEAQIGVLQSMLDALDKWRAIIDPVPTSLAYEHLQQMEPFNALS